jgi:hypothetical protein
MRVLNITCTRDNHYPFRDLIYDQGGTLRLQVFNRQTERFKPSAFELHYYGDNFGEELVFETIGYKGENEQDIEALIRWYSHWIGYPKMKFYKNPPLI